MKVIIDSLIRIPKKEYPYIEKLKNHLIVKSLNKFNNIEQIVATYKEDDNYLSVPRALNTKERRKELGWEEQDNTVIGQDIDIQDRKHQFRTVEQELIYKDILKGQSGILNVYTALGKTFLAIRYLCELKKKFIIFVHVGPLINQWIDRLVEFSTLNKEDIGIIGDKRKETDSKYKGYICLVQTGYRFEFPENMIKEIGACIYDEAHIFCGEKYSEVLHCLPARIRLGLTATLREDGLDKLLFLHLGPVLSQKERTEGKAKIIFKKTGIFTKEKYIWPARIKLNLSRMSIDLSLNKKRNEIILSLIDDLIGEGKKILILSAYKEQLYFLNSNVKDSGIVTGDKAHKNYDYREEQYKKQVIFATYRILSTGLDIKDLNALILATPIAGYVPGFQTKGRVERVENSVVYIPVDQNEVYNNFAKKLERLYTERNYKIEYR